MNDTTSLRENQEKKKRKPKGAGKRSGNERAKQIGKRIRDERKANGFKDQLSLATEMYVAQNTISSWETGAVIPSMEQLFQLAKLFHCDVAYLLCDYDDRSITDKWISERIGLSETAIALLEGLNTAPHIEASGASFGRDGKVFAFPILGILDEIITSDLFKGMSTDIGRYLFYRELSKKEIDINAEDLMPKEYERMIKFADSRGMELIRRKEIYEMYLQAAVDKFKEIIKSIEVEGEL